MGVKIWHIIALCWWWSPWGLAYRLADSRIGDYWAIIEQKAYRNYKEGEGGE